MTTKVAVTFKVVGKATYLVSKIDGYEVIDGRDFFQKQVLKIHGECQLRSHTGQFMRAVRDPNVRRPTAKEADRNAPRPDHCMCKEWGMPHPGRHHPVCEWNFRAPLEEQALPTDGGETIVQQKMVPHRLLTEKPSILDVKPRKNAAESGLEGAFTVVAEPVAKLSVPSPDDCICKDFEMPGGGKRPSGVHHPVCEYLEAWEAQNLPKMMLVSLASGRPLRRATAAEVKEASGERAYVTIGGEQYGVVPESEVSSTVAAE